MTIYTFYTLFVPGYSAHPTAVYNIKTRSLKSSSKIRMKAWYADERDLFWNVFAKSILFAIWLTVHFLFATQPLSPVLKLRQKAAMQCQSRCGKEFEPLRFRCCRKGTYQSHTVIPSCHSHTHQVLCKYLTDGWMTLWKIVETIPFEESWYILASWRHLWGPRTLHLGPLKKSLQVPRDLKDGDISHGFTGSMCWHMSHGVCLLKRYAVYMHFILAFLWYSDHIVATNYDPIFAYL